MPERLKIAAVTTIYFKISHAEEIVDRLLDGYGWNGTHHRPPMDLVSLYVNQVQKDDWSRERLKRHPEVRDSPTILDALTLGGAKLAVDGVVLVGEHGHYPVNERARPHILATSSSSRLWMSIKRAESPCRSSATSIFRGIGSGRKRCTTRRARWGSRSWPDRAFR